MQPRTYPGSPVAASAVHQAATPINAPTLEGLAGHTQDNLTRSHAIIDRIEAVVFGPEPPNVSNGPGPGNPPGLLGKMDCAVGSSASLADRLSRIADRMGG